MEVTEPIRVIGMYRRTSTVLSSRRLRCPSAPCKSPMGDLRSTIAGAESPSLTTVWEVNS